jgi:hypothetical protein
LDLRSVGVLIFLGIVSASSQLRKKWQSVFFSLPFSAEVGPEKGGGSQFFRAIVFNMAGVDYRFHLVHNQPWKVGQFHPGKTHTSVYSLHL